MKSVFKKTRYNLSRFLCLIGVWVLNKITHKNYPMSLEAWRYAEISFSQFGEDLLIARALEYLKKNEIAFYVDVGAFNPFLFSNTFRLRHLGWSGINVDAQRKHIEEFNKYCPDNINIHAAVYSESGTEKFLCYNYGTTGRLAKANLSTSQSTLGENVLEVQEVVVETLAHLLGKHAPLDRPFGLLSIDCEGADFEVLKSNDWEKYKPWIVAIEDSSLNEGTVDSFLKNYGYELFAIARLTKIYIDRSL
jgi:FkbM family methyltransferase